MSANSRTASLTGDLLRWSARVLSVVSTCLLLLFLLGEPFNASQGRAREWLGLIFFPLGIIIGAVVGWWKEGLGGGITVAGLIIFSLIFGFLLRGRISQEFWFFVFASPGLLFLASHGISRRRRLARAADIAAVRFVYSRRAEL